MSRRLTYLLPVRRTKFSAEEADRFAAYFQFLRKEVDDVIVVNGSPAPVFEPFDERWGSLVRHTRVDPQYRFLNGKVNGVHTGTALAATEKIVLADDDIRYSAENLSEMEAMLDRFELVRPQNFLRPLPWWAMLEAARMLLNRAVLKEGDYPGTCGYRKSAFYRVGPYDGDVLFDNEEIVRHFAAQGASVGYAVNCFILKRPPTLSKWWEQRPRQAYEDFVMKAKTVFFLSLLPGLALAAIGGGVKAFGAISFVIAASAIGLAIRGRYGRARAVVPWPVVLAAPLWLLERAFSVWWALYWRCVKGGYPFGDALLSKGTGRDWLAGRVPRKPARTFAADHAYSRRS
jgi:hypothetical protein